MSAARVVLVDDHPVVRQGLVAMLSWSEEIDVVGAVASAQEALDLVASERPDVVVTDLRLGDPRRDGVWLAAQLGGEEDPAVLILTTYDHDRDIVRAVEAGAVGYLLKDAEPEAIINAVQAAAAGHDLVDADLTARVVDTLRQPRPELSERETDVLREVAQGASNREIARRLFITEATVKTHLVRAFAKLGVDSRTAAVARAHDLGLLDLS